MAQRRPLAAHGFILGYLALQLLLVVTCYARDAKFFGWQMFSHGFLYRLAFQGVRGDGAREPLPAERVQALFTDRATRSWLGTAGRYRVFSRGDRFLLTEAQRLPAFFCQRLADLRYDRMEVAIEHRTAADSAMRRDVFSAACRSHP